MLHKRAKASVLLILSDVEIPTSLVSPLEKKQKKRMKRKRKEKGSIYVATAALYKLMKNWYHYDYEGVYCEISKMMLVSGENKYNLS